MRYSECKRCEQVKADKFSLIPSSPWSNVYDNTAWIGDELIIIIRTEGTEKSHNNNNNNNDTEEMWICSTECVQPQATGIN